MENLFLNQKRFEEAQHTPVAKNILKHDNTFEMSSLFDFIQHQVFRFIKYLVPLYRSINLQSVYFQHLHKAQGNLS